MTDHVITREGIIHCEQPAPYVDTTVQQNGVTYAGRLYPVNPHELPQSERVEIVCKSSGKLLGRGDASSLYYYCKMQSCKALHRLSITEYLKWYTEGKGVFRIGGRYGE